MREKLRRKESSNRISKKPYQESQGCSSDQHPWISFRYMTTNKGHSLAFLDALDSRDREVTMRRLLERLEEISSRPWLDWTGLRRQVGFETLPKDEITFQAAQDAPLTSDMKLYIFRFDTNLGSGKGRIIGFKNHPCAAYHIIGYDFDFTAYAH